MIFLFHRVHFEWTLLFLPQCLRFHNTLIRWVISWIPFRSFGFVLDILPQKLAWQLLLQKWSQLFFFPKWELVKKYLLCGCVFVYHNFENCLLLLKLLTKLDHFKCNIIAFCGTKWSSLLGLNMTIVVSDFVNFPWLQLGACNQHYWKERKKVSMWDMENSIQLLPLLLS